MILTLFLQATVREDYSVDGDAWSHFPHDHARSRAYRWGEDGIAGISDNHQRLCLALSLWNEEDPILKERFFGVTGHQGNHGEDVKELYYYLDSTPTHSYMKFLYKYPQKRYPYEELVRENVNRGRDVPEFEILDTDAFDDDRYWDVFVEVTSSEHLMSIYTHEAMQYAKDEQDPEGVYMRITSYNRGPEPATLHVIPQLWFPNTWSWNDKHPPKPSLSSSGEGVITTKHETLGRYHLYCLPSPPPVDSQGEEVNPDADAVAPELLFTENDTNYYRLYGGQNETPYVKDAFHDHIISSHRPPIPDEDDTNYFMTRIHSQTSAHRTTPSGVDQAETPPNEREQGPRTPFPINATFVNPEKKGTKAAAHYIFREVPPRGGCAVVRLKLTPRRPEEDLSIEDEGIFDDTVEERREEANEFFAQLVQGPISDDFKQIMRQAFGGMLWTKQYYQFIQKTWIEGDPAQPPPPPERKWIRNKVCTNYMGTIMFQLLINYRNGDIFTSLIFFRCRTSKCPVFSYPILHGQTRLQMGISFLRCVGYGIPLYSTCTGRSFIREKTARLADTRVVHEARWTNSGV